jgi:hypothetical protein
MALFRRKKDAEELDAQAVDGAPAQSSSDEPVSPSGGEPPPGRPRGPWDAEDAPDDDLQRLDLGGLRVPIPPHTEVRVEVSQQGQVVAATLVRGQSAMQVSAFAAPRTEGIWAEVREEIAAALREGGGHAEEVEGEHGPELRAGVPTEVPGQGRVIAPARFIGVDGPRWFLRAMLTGPAATEREPATDLETALRAVVVVRGSDPMAVRDPLPLQLPKGVQEAAAQQQAAQQAEPPRAPGVPQRGPEITEIR